MNLNGWNPKEFRGVQNNTPENTVISPQHSKKDALQILTKGRAKQETRVVDYVRDMLTTVGIKSGEFTLNIVTRVVSGGSHHLGIELKNVQRNAVRMLVQYGDNGTRFECYLSSPEYKPKQLLICISSHHSVHADHYVKTVKTNTAPAIPKDLEDRVSDLRGKVTRLTQARQRVENINLELSKIEGKKKELESELALQLGVVNDTGLQKAETDLMDISNILKI